MSIWHKKNALVNSLLELENEKTFFGKTEPLDNFFYGSSVIGDKIYFICRVLDEDGESNAVVFSYDISTDAFAFLYHGFSSDMPNIYLIPRE